MRRISVVLLLIAALGLVLARLLTRPRPPAAGQAGIEWVRIPGGSFLMGVDGEEHATPIHRVRSRLSRCRARR